MPNPIITEAIDQIANHRDLTRVQSAAVLHEIMGGRAEGPEVAAFLMGLRVKGETVHEVAGLAETMRMLSAAVSTDRSDLVDTAGTGGGRSTFNISTTAALIAAGAGCGVAKHGNRSATSRSGSADVLEALGVNIDLAPDQVARCIDEVGFGFMFAPAHHAATRYVVPIRKALGIRTVFNVLGPLTNPAGANRQLVGVVEESLIDLVAGALAELDVTHALVVSSADGLDEISVSAATHVAEVRGQQIDRYELRPEDVGIDPVPEAALPAGGSPEENAAVTRSILAGQGGPQADIAVLNAGATIYVSGDAGSIAAGIDAARAAIASGAAAAALDGYIARSHELVRGR